VTLSTGSLLVDRARIGHGRSVLTIGPRHPADARAVTRAVRVQARVSHPPGVSAVHHV